MYVKEKLKYFFRRDVVNLFLKNLKLLFVTSKMNYYFKKKIVFIFSIKFRIHNKEEKSMKYLSGIQFDKSYLHLESNENISIAKPRIRGDLNI